MGEFDFCYLVFKEWNETGIMTWSMSRKKFQSYAILRMKI